jgi:predicted amidohydrolase
MGINPMVRFDEVRIGLDRPDLHERIQIALANIRVLESNVEASYLRQPNLSRKRLKPFANLLNEISSHRNSAGKKIDLVIFPEVSVPYSWESMIVAWARKHHIGIVCGLEHHVDPSGHARNEVLAALPYKADEHYWACVPIRRLKRLYSPEETFVLTNEGLSVPSPSNPYQLFKWRGASFAIYNCYELASIEDRGLFKGKVDFIVGTEFNRDVRYFGNIVESAARDLHCYVIQVNDSRFGDSRVVSPSKLEKMNPVRIKGGENLTFLTMHLELKALRTHQRKGYGLQKDSDEFKPTPPGVRLRDIQERIGLGK